MRTKKAGVGIIIGALAGLAIASFSARNAWAVVYPVPDTQKTNYLPNSHIAGADTVNVTDPFERSSSQQEVICAGFYVFDQNEQLQECCGCPISEDGLLTVQSSSGSTGASSATAPGGDLVSNPFFLKGGASTPLPFANVKIVSFNLNAPNPVIAAQNPFICDATGGTYPYGQYPFPSLRADNNTGEGVATMSLSPCLPRWATHLQNQTNLTESEFRDVPLLQSDANNYAEWCGDIQQAGSGGC